LSAGVQAVADNGSSTLLGESQSRARVSHVDLNGVGDASDSRC
jgi:hypothetical protein